MSKKIIIIFLTLLVVVGGIIFLASCGDKSDNTSSSVIQTDLGQSDNTPKPSESNEYSVQEISEMADNLK